ncbi:uncharacterized protein LOC144135095 [Amblyomma americanum]
MEAPFYGCDLGRPGKLQEVPRPPRCLPRTLPDLYGPKTCAVWPWWQKALGHSSQAVFRAGACLYEMLPRSENGEPIQMHRENYGEHMQNFERDSIPLACVWVFVLCVVLMEAVALSKMLLDDVAALVALYKGYSRQQRRGAVTRSEAFHSASLHCLRRTHYPLVLRCIWWLDKVWNSTFNGLQQPFNRPDPTLGINAPSAAMNIS